MKKFLVGMIAVLAMIAACGQRADAAAKIALLNSSTYSYNYFNRNYESTKCTLTPGMELTLGANEYNRYWMGWRWLLKNMGLKEGADKDFVVITDSEITTANFSDNFSKNPPRYEILILSNTVSMSKDQMQIIQQWVLSGGKLLATFGSGYEEIVLRANINEEIIKNAKGHTDGLHDLWQDPLNKLFSSTAVADFTNIKITNNSAPGPLAGVQGNIAEDSMQAFYGRWANMLVQRPEDHRTVFATLRFYNFGTVQQPWVPVDWRKPQPAVISNSHGKGWVVYYAFSPEFNISLEFPDDTAGKCPNDSRDFTNASAGVIPMMQATVNYLINLQTKGQ